MFCPKCGKEIPDQAVFCPKCGAPLQSAGSQPPAAPAESGNQLARAISIASPTQKTAGKAYIGVLLVDLILAGLWLCDTFVWNALEISQPVSLFTLFHYGGYARFSVVLLSVTFALGILGPAISGLFLTRHMLKQDGKVNGSLLSWLYLIWAAGVFALFLYAGKEITAEDGGRIDLSLFGWLYVVCCAVLLALLVFLIVLHFKAAKERKAQPIPQ